MTKEEELLQASLDMKKPEEVVPFALPTPPPVKTAIPSPFPPRTVTPSSPTSPTPTQKPGPPKPPATPQPTTVTSAVRASNIRTFPPELLARLEKQKFNTNDVVSPWFRCFLYGDIDSGKTVTAARFGTPENVRIILTRQKEQVLPLKKEGYKAFHANTVEMFRYAVMYPEVIWPEWTKLADPTMILDDVTQIKDMLNDENSTNKDGDEVRDIRKISKGSKDDLREIIQLSALNRPMNLIIVALERSWEEGKEIKVSPDLPPSMSNMLKADLEYVFYLKKNSPVSRTLFTEMDREAFVKKDDKGKETPYFINRFARAKLPVSLMGKGIIKPKEPADLRGIWERVRQAIK